MVTRPERWKLVFVSRRVSDSQSDARALIALDERCASYGTSDAALKRQVSSWARASASNGAIWYPTSKTCLR